MKKYKYIILILAIFIISPLVLSIESSLFQYRESIKIKTSSWTPDGTVICNASFEQGWPEIISDGVGGAIIVWTDNRSGVDYDIYAQRIDSDGITQWPDNGVIICSANHSQGGAKITTDGAGGAIIVWVDGRSGVIWDTYAQRINSNGITQWTPNGTAICTEMGTGGIEICSDGAGGALITWGDLRNGIESDIYAQKVNSNGIPQWIPNGIALCTVSRFQELPQICGDGTGGAIISWHDLRRPDAKGISYAQKVNSNGIPQWAPNGTAISPEGSATSHFFSPEIIPDGAGGAIIIYGESRLVNGVSLKTIYAQGVNSSGIIQWLPNGTAICMLEGYGTSGYGTCSDGAGGAIVSWDEERGGSYNHDIYAQKIESNGDTQWTPNGTAICTSESSQIASEICSDGAGGAIITWNDRRNSFPDYDIYAQKIDSNGNVQWTQDGVAICTAADHQEYHKICSDGDGGAFITWVDYRAESSSDIYAYRIDSTGGITAGDGNNGVISFGDYFFVFTIISIISLIVIIKYRKFKE